MESSHEFFMSEALKEAQKAALEGEVPVGGVVVCEGKIIARAYNMVEKLNDPTAHAEMQLITMATHHLGGKYLNECDLYVTLEPCVMCAGALHWAQLKSLIFGAKDEKRGFSKFGTNILHPKTEIKGGIMERECREILLNFFKGLR
ncbi:MAG: nucleoside deaminase [Bacteroidia bacterium]|nr:nucleoside deaminase [Bacteroidia bacterium]